MANRVQEDDYDGLRGRLFVREVEAYNSEFLDFMQACSTGRNKITFLHAHAGQEAFRTFIAWRLNNEIRELATQVVGIRAALLNV